MPRTIGLSIALGFALTSVAASARAGSGPVTIAAANRLATGQSLWAADPGEGEVEIVVSLPMQRLFVYRGGELIGATTVSTGKPGKATPTGEFLILEKNIFHRSNLYSDAPMPFMQRLTWSGIAMHAGYLPGRPASHGCIRMPRAFAKKLYALTSLDTPVLVTNQAAPEHYDPPPPPRLVADISDYEGDRYAIVTDDHVAFAPAGATVFDRNRAVVQPISAN
ncbi:L,D-transpeptidase family protein [Stakelama saccharophila]|uniref:L,D-transpeptidase family protein n=1 Tax=Stakelama saccharophila TaxID=3075605 RepID=A0ABZ0B8P6_9SPHN|nr:L,D-transpeptidase family protein [Stakelama sp. W311]WNO52976.1 L,D-transpeptidase family protein [Stakelama sp. W311]